MKKIEEAAEEAELAALRTHDFGDDHFVEGFEAGARYVLDQLTSSKAVKVASESQAVDDEGAFPALGDLIGFSGENKTRTIVLAALAAVRKEIEG